MSVALWMHDLYTDQSCVYITHFCFAQYMLVSILIALVISAPSQFVMCSVEGYVEWQLAPVDPGVLGLRPKW